MIVSHDHVVAGPANGAPPTRAMLLLHGTGGDEHDLLPLGREVAPDALLIGVRGRVLEGGAPRFFRRLAEGVFDEADLVARAADLAGWLEDAFARLGPGLPRAALGYSNGANMLAGMLLLHGPVVDQAVLMRPMVPLRPAHPRDLAGVGVLALSGMADPIAPPTHGAAVAHLLRASGADVTETVLAASHGLTRLDVSKAAAFLPAVVAA